MGAVLKFFVLTYIVSWTCFIGATYLKISSQLAILSGPLLLLGVFTPSLVGLALTARADGRVGIRTLLRQLAVLPSSIGWYLFAAGYIAAIKLAAALLHRLITGGWPPFRHEIFFVMLVATAVSTPVQAGEEIGWRGYALPRLANGLGLGTASIVLGVIWASWHLPFFFIPGSDTLGQSFPVYLLQVTALSVAMAWLYWRTNGSLLLTMLMHAAVNNIKDIVPSTLPGAMNPFTFSSSLVAWLTVALLWICALYFLIRMRGKKLQIAALNERDLPARS